MKRVVRRGAGRNGFSRARVLIRVGLIALLLPASCGRRDETAPAARGAPAGAQQAGGNLITNASFEEGRAPWFSMENPFWGDFEISDARARSGTHSALLPLRSRGPDLPTLVQGVVAEIATGRLPRHLSGYYRVDRWQRGARNQYVQALVSVTGARNLPDPRTSKQLAYVLTGVLDPVHDIPFRPFIFLGGREPELGRWIRFETDIENDYREHYGVVPEGFEHLRVYLEARFEMRDAGEDDDAIADVYFDDIYLGDGPD